LKFGSFTLKSGRISPYFFNAGLFHTGSAITELGKYYAAAIKASGLEYDVVFGPAYKGIPLASSTVIALYTQHGIDKPFSFNRKEIKDHGERGNIVGAALNGRILIIDDVITAGTAIREGLDLINGNGAQAAAVLVAVDRQERGQGALSAIQELAKEHNLPVKAIVTMSQIIEYLEEQRDQKEIVNSMKSYLAQYRSEEP